ncbi:transposase [Trichothermofontia sp.]
MFETHQTPELAKKQIFYNHFISRTTSGMMEGMNNKLKLIKRQAYGFMNFDNFRARLLACCSHE